MKTRLARTARCWQFLATARLFFGIQGLWSAAHHRIPVTFVIANNRQYKILKNCGQVMPLPQLAAGNYVGMDLVQPEIDFVALANSLGVEAKRVEEPAALGEQVRDSLKGNKPVLLEVPLAG